MTAIVTDSARALESPSEPALVRPGLMCGKIEAGGSADVFASARRQVMKPPAPVDIAAKRPARNAERYRLMKRAAQA